MKEKPTENRIFTGSDKEFTSEQTYNLLRSPEFSLVQKNRIKKILKNTVSPQIAAARRNQQVMMAIQLIRPTKDGDLLAGILECRFAGYTYKRIAKTLMKLPSGPKCFTSLKQAIKYVEDSEKEAKYRVKVALENKSKIILP